MSQRTQVIVLAILGIVVVGVLVFQMTRKPPGPPIPQGGASKAAAAKTGDAAAKKTVAGKTAAAAGKTEADDAVQIKKADVNIDDLLSGIKEVDFDYEQSRLPRDPMAPLVGTLTRRKDGGEAETAAAPATAVGVMSKVVSGILWDGRRPLAVVDNEVVYPGYIYADGATVESIERDNVTFKVGDSLIQNPLKEF